MRILIDVGVGKAVEEWLKKQGYDVLAVRDLDPRLPDSVILHRAVIEQRLVITMDKDFGELVYQSGQPHAGVLLLRLEEADSRKKVSIVKKIFTRYVQQLVGSFSVYQRGRLRIRH